MTEPLWQNEQWMIFEDGIYHKIGNYVDLGFSAGKISENPAVTFRHLVQKGFEGGPLYEAFLQLATYWGLKCDYDALRKIRDQAKEPVE